jgi:hypothetical protein
VFLDQKNIRYFCKDIVFEIIENLQPTPPPTPDFSQLTIRKEHFEDGSNPPGFHFDLFVDQYGLNLYRNLLNILGILEGSESYSVESTDKTGSEEPNKSKFSKEKSINHKINKNQPSILLDEKKNKNAFGENMEKQVSTNKNKDNLTSNMVTLVVDKNFYSKNQLYSQMDSTLNNSGSKVPVEVLIPKVFAARNTLQKTDLFWDMKMDTLHTLKQQILAKCDYLNEGEHHDLSESISGRINVLEDASLLKKPETSVLFGQMREQVLQMIEQVVDLVDTKREELEMPAFWEKEEEKKEVETVLAKDKVYL